MPKQEKEKGKTLTVNPRTHQRVKLAAVTAGMKLAEYVERALAAKAAA